MSVQYVDGNKPLPEVDSDEGQYVLRFGRFRGLTIQEVYETNKSYVRWLSTQYMYLEDTPKIAEYIRDKMKYEDTSLVIHWGRNKGKSLNWIKKNDPKYLDYLSKNDFVRTNCKLIYEEVMKLKSLESPRE